jgi:hypothetical protein
MLLAAALLLQRDPLILELGRVLAAGEYGNSSSSSSGSAGNTAVDTGEGTAAAAAAAMTGRIGLADPDAAAAAAAGDAGGAVSSSRQQRWTCRFVLGLRLQHEHIDEAGLSTDAFSPACQRLWHCCCALVASWLPACACSLHTACQVPHVVSTAAAAAASCKVSAHLVLRWQSQAHLGIEGEDKLLSVAAVTPRPPDPAGQE